MKSLRSGLLVLIASGVTAWAAPSSIEGTVKDAKGHPLGSADVRIEGQHNVSKAVKSDARGHYVSGDLPAGTYRVTLLVGGAVKASIKNVNVKLAESTQLNFDLKNETGTQAKKKATHMVYVPAETGSHLGGRWVEVDDNGNTNAASGDNVQKVDGTAIRSMQSGTSSGGPASGGR